MLSVSLFVASALAAPPAGTPALVVWMLPTPPSAELTRLAERETGPADHRAWLDITVSLEPVTSADEARSGALATVFKDGGARWGEFEAEAGVARALAAAVEPIAVLPGTAQRDLLLAALLWEGAGITRSYPEGLFSSLQETSPFRVTIAGKSVVRPWLDAIALDPKRVYTRAEFPDGQSFAKVQAFQAEMALLPRGHLAVDVLPPGLVVVLDGSPLPEGTRDADLAPGHHYAHVLVDGQVAERLEFDVAGSDTVPLRCLVSPEELAAAGAAVQNGSVDIPADVATGIRSLAARRGAAPRVFLASIDAKGKPRVVAFGGGAVVVRKRPVTVQIVAELGGGVLESNGFSGNGGQQALTYQFGGSFGFELGIYNAALYGSADLALTPAAQMAFGVDGGNSPEDNQHTSAYIRPSGGVGVYLPRPLPGKVWFLLGGHYGWFAPSSMGPGVKLSVGIPLQEEGATWLRVTVDGYRGTQMAGFPQEGTATSMASLRLGFGSLL
ncbi:MAG: hypothetical protein EXR71_15690 [Myxococcales bacterium]|nr:hypothetical protein [Myxococcales bacterium]